MAGRPQQLPAVHEAWLPREHALHRPRHGGRQLTALICALLFFVTPTMLWVFGGRPAEIENHKLAGFPSVSDGWGMFTGLPAWATDQLVFREAAISAADGISRALFGEPAPFDQGGQAGAGPLPGSPPVPDGEQRGGTDGRSPTDAGYRRVIQGTGGWLYYGLDTDAKCSPAQPVAETIAGVDKLRRAVESSGRRFVFVVAPDKTTMVPQHLPASYPGKDCSRAASGEFWRLATGKGGALDLRPELNAAARHVGAPVYFSNGTHWTDAGAIVLTRSLAEAVRPGISESWTAKPIGEYTSSADLPPLMGREGTKTTSLYDLRPNGRIDRAILPVETLDAPVHRRSAPLSATVNQPTLILGDSFTGASSRYLPAGFTDLTMLGYASILDDPRPAISAMVDANVVVLQVVERALASGKLPFGRDEFIARAREALAAQPVR